MRSAIAMVLFGLGVTVFFRPSPAAEPVPGTAADSVFWIALEKGDSLEARAVQVAWSDFVRYRRPDGSTQYLPANRIAHIYGSDGLDVRDRVLRDHKPFPGPDAFGPAPKYRSLAFRGGDRTHCASFMLTEAGVFVPLSGAAADQDLFGSVDFGWMKNTGSRSAWGSSAFWESGSDHNRGGVRLRYRRWIDDRVSVELAPGIVFAGNDTYNAPGFIGQVSLNAGDLMSFVVEGEHERYRYQYWYWNGSNTVSTPVQSTSNTTFRAGVRAGSYLGAGSMVVAGALLVAVAAAFSSGSFY